MPTMESASAVIVKRYFATKRAIGRHRATHDRQFVCTSRARCEEGETNSICVSWDGVSRMTAAVLAASLVVSSPDMLGEWTFAHAEDTQTPDELRSATIERRKKLLRAARERVLRQVSRNCLKNTNCFLFRERRRNKEMTLYPKRIRNQRRNRDWNC